MKKTILTYLVVQTIGNNEYWEQVAFTNKKKAIAYARNLIANDIHCANHQPLLTRKKVLTEVRAYDLGKNIDLENIDELIELANEASGYSISLEKKHEAY